MTACPSQEKNRKDCTCSFACDKRGRCCECVAYHRDRGELPGCFFSREGERQGDRSLEALVRDRR